MTDLAVRLTECMLKAKVLRFGQFETKSGRLSPYFFNFGAFDSGLLLGGLADIYAAHIASNFPSVENLFGPAYKGIPLAVMTAERLTNLLGRDVTFTFDRKEVKDHGEGGWLVGHPYAGGEKTVVIEDVITGGTSLRHTIPRLQAAGVHVLGAVVGVDRQERGFSNAVAATEIFEQYDVPVKSITDIDRIVKVLHNQTVLHKVWIDDAIAQAIANYRQTYGAI